MSCHSLSDVLHSRKLVIFTKSLLITAGDDYVVLDSVSLTLSNESGRGCVEVHIIPDDILEDMENFSVSLDSSARNSTPSVTIFIVDTSRFNTPPMTTAPIIVARCHSCVYDWGAAAGGW